MVILNKKYLLYGFGTTNYYISKIFDIEEVEYIIYSDDLNKTVNFGKLLKDIDIIVKSPGIVFDTKLLQYAKSIGVTILSDLELIYLLKKEKTYLVITGTNGKTTTAYLASCILNHDENNKWLLGGNIGIPLFSLYKEKNVDGYLIEASSFMLHDTYSLKPHVFALTNISSHHLDYHKTFNNYCHDKVKIIKNMNESDYLIYNKDDEYLGKLISKFDKPMILTVSLESDATCYIKGEDIYYLDELIVNINDLKRREKPFLYDIMIAIVIGKIYQVKNELIRQELINFSGLEFRIEKIYDENNIIILNDSKSTSVMATYYAINVVLDNYKEFKKVLIMGGVKKDLDYDKLKEVIYKMDEVYFYGASSIDFYNMFKHKKSNYYDNLETLIDNLNLEKKTIVLFSPSCQSYDQFDSYIDRGNKFNEYIFKKVKFLT